MSLKGFNTSSYPSNVSLEVGTPDGNYEWNVSGVFNYTNQTTNFSQQINSYLPSCSGAYCLINLTIHSDTAGILQYSNLNLDWHDSKAPRWSNNYSNTTSVVVNDFVLVNITWTDYLNLSHIIFESNFTGTLKNDTPIKVANNVSYDFKIIRPINATNHPVVAWRFYANDSSNNWNKTSYWYINITNSNPTFNNTMPDTTISHSTNLELKANCSDIDSDTIYYYDNTTLFNISISNGSISDNPTQAEAGIYYILLTCSDGTSNTTTQTFKYNITNTKPSVTSVQIVNSTSGNTTINDNEDANCSFIATDVDSDTMTYYFEWIKDGTGNLNINRQTLAEGNYSSGDKINCSVIANDGVLNSTQVWSSLLTFGDTTPPVINNVTLLNSSWFKSNFTSIYSDDYIYISANVTDASPINQVLAQIDKPDNTKANVTMTLSSGNVYVGLYSEVGLLQVGTFNVSYIHAQEGNNWNHNVNYLNFTTSSRPFKIYNASVSPISGYTTTSFNISWFADSGIAMSTCKVLIRDNNDGSTQWFDTTTGVTAGSNNNWNLVKTGTQLGGDVTTSGYDYNVSTNISCTDTNTNTNSTVEFNYLGITVTTYVPPVSPTGGGGGITPTTEKLEEKLEQLFVKGDGICEADKGESIWNSAQDCSVNFENIVCLNPLKRCAWSEAWFLNSMIYGVIGLFAFRFYKKGKR